MPLTPVRGRSRVSPTIPPKQATAMKVPRRCRFKSWLRAIAFVQNRVVNQNRKAAASLTSIGFVDPENPPPDFHPQGSRCVRGRRKTNSESNLGSYWWTASSKNKRAPLTDVTTAAFAVLVDPILVPPPKDSRPFQREAHVAPGAPRDQSHLRIVTVEFAVGLLS